MIGKATMRNAGIIYSKGGRTKETDPTIVEYGKLLASANEDIRLVSGRLLKEVFTSRSFKRAYQAAADRGINVEIITGPAYEEDSIKVIQGYGLKVMKLDKWPSAHFAVVDNKSVRLEEPHPEQVNTCEQYIIKDADRELVGDLNQLFARYKEAAEPLVLEGVQ